MRAVQARKIERVLTRYGAILNWNDWAFYVSTKPTERLDILAESIIDYRRSSTAFCKDFHEYTPEAQRRVFCHELVHIFIRRFGEMVKSVEKALGPDHFAGFKKITDDAEEEIAEHLEHVLSGLVPLPEIESGRKLIPAPAALEDDDE